MKVKASIRRGLILSSLSSRLMDGFITFIGRSERISDVSYQSVEFGVEGH